MKKFILILTHFEPEFTALKSLIRIKKTRIYAGRVIVIGRLKGGRLPLILTMTGVGTTNATLTAQALVDLFCIKFIVDVGIAGGVNPEINIGDVIIPEVTGLYQQQVYARLNNIEGCTNCSSNTDCFSVPPFLTDVNYGNYDFIFPQGTEVLDGTITSTPKTTLFQDTSRKLRDCASKVLNKIVLKRCLEVEGQQLCLEQQPKLYIDGAILSGSTFVDNNEYRQWLIDNPTLNTPEHPLYAVDEETAAINFVAHQNKIPFIAIRSVSDLAGGRAGPNELLVFLPISLENLNLVTKAFLKGYQNICSNHSCRKTSTSQY
jgi:adenosylhomocysteine nucleosidase